MKIERLTRFLGRIIAIVPGVFLLLGEISGANSPGLCATDNSRNQSQQSPKPADKQTNKTTADPSSFTPEMPFSEAIDILRNSTVPPLNIAVLWRDLEENADIYRDTPIGIDGVSKVPLRTHLKLLLRSVSAGSGEELGYVIDEGVTVTTMRDRAALAGADIVVDSLAELKSDDFVRLLTKRNR